MALIKCHECRGQISDHARTCPHCGAPVIATIKRRQKAARMGLIIQLIVVVVIAVGFWIWWQRTAKSILAPLKEMEQKQQAPH